MKLVKPKKLEFGDKVATVSLSWGGAGDKSLLWRYELGKKRLQELWGFQVVEMDNTLKGSEFVYNHPEKRAADLMKAFRDPSIKAIFSCIGGDDSIRMLPYIDFDIIEANPKIFIGYSDTTVTHFMCMKTGLSSFYGPSILAEFAENINIFDYTKDNFEKVLLKTEVIGEIKAAKEWTGERIEWTEDNKTIAKKMEKNLGYEVLQGKGITTGHLIGGCIEVMEMMKGTSLWPTIDEFKGALLFFDTSEDMPHPNLIKYWLRNYGAQGILQNISGILWSKPYENKYYEEYKEVILTVMKEYNLQALPILYNMNFGHTEPMITIPYGAMGQIDCEKGTFSILENGVK